MKSVQRILAALAALSLIIVLLITAAEGAIYLDFQFYQKEYEKYEVLDDLDMNMEDVMDVTHKMMAYLRGDREELVVNTYVDGKEQDFFNEQDWFHMAEVRDIFCNALTIRWGALGIFIVSMTVLFIMKANWRKLVAGWFMGLTAAFAAIAGVLAYFITRNFSQCFVIFHEIFFDNDLWIFNPETDYMIRMLPEGLFADFAARIGIFAVGVLILFVIAAWILYKLSKRKEEDRDLFNIS